MKKFEIVSKAEGMLKRTGLKIQKHSPEILIIVGVAGVVASAVMACKASMKAKPILDKAKNDLDEIKETYSQNQEQNENEETPAITEEKKAVVAVYTRTGLEFVKLYAPALTLGALSITSILASNNILRKRSASLGAALATTTKAFDDYRGRVIERFGSDVDKELKYNLQQADIVETKKDEETGEEKSETTKAYKIDPKRLTEYQAIFDKYVADDHGNMVPNEQWTNDYNYNQMFLNGLEMHFTNLLREKGRVFLNEVREEIGLPATKAGQIVGWVYDPKAHDGDNMISFGREDFAPVYDDEGNRVILLNFNCDGNIWDNM